MNDKIVTSQNLGDTQQFRNVLFVGDIFRPFGGGGGGANTKFKKKKKRRRFHATKFQSHPWRCENYMVSMLFQEFSMLRAVTRLTTLLVFRAGAAILFAEGPLWVFGTTKNPIFADAEV